MATPFGMNIASRESEISVNDTQQPEASSWTGTSEASAIDVRLCTTFGIGPISYERSLSDMGPPICGG
ncbi:hypothetical protein CDO52_12425 [Nocardiopsis gilva YIM 90087]|uniref:Uncharacterized protein n=1 Tax=Nocardiopsis gilva YIM 90087 TaxID=1235441 RepID=A0A223S5T5_9ACTN|nr:hypothetical protein [Nocardiopsis gilva]ASU83484.1 hypothetical protein CDO52_12425 [Nocardiopsis gilva YIM 90087]